MKILFVYAFVVFGVCACTSAPIDGVSERVADLPEAVGGINFFVYLNVVPVQPADRMRFAQPDLLKMEAAESDADGYDPSAQIRPLLVTLREHIHLPFRNAGIPAKSYVAGSRYRWDELRRDRLNYRLTVWATRSQVAGQPEQVDLWFALQNEAAGRRVWTRVVKNAFASLLAGGSQVTDSRQVALAEKIANDTMAALTRDGVVLPVH
jgi:hypothetical protein